MNNGNGFNALQQMDLSSLTVAIATNPAKRDYSLHTTEFVSKEDTLYGICIRNTFPGAKAVDGNNVANAVVLNSSFLELKVVGNKDHHRLLPLELIKTATTNGSYFPTGGIKVDMIASKILCKLAPTNNESLEITFLYLPQSNC